MVVGVVAKIRLDVVVLFGKSAVDIGLTDAPPVPATDVDKTDSMVEEDEVCSGLTALLPLTVCVVVRVDVLVVVEVIVLV